MEFANSRCISESYLPHCVTSFWLMLIHFLDLVKKWVVKLQSSLDLCKASKK
jgi:hypothetical protein